MRGEAGATEELVERVVMEVLAVVDCVNNIESFSVFCMVCG